jgi:dihydrofolate synthase/folylpolyglutamate synthase
MQDAQASGGYHRAVVAPPDSHQTVVLAPALPGRFQIENALTAATAARLLAERGFPVTDDAIERGIATVRWPGRLERISERPALYLDGTHNPAGARELVKFWKENFAGSRIVLVYGAMRDKAVDEIAGLLFPHTDAVILTEPRQPRAISASVLAEIAGHLAKHSVVISDPDEALERAITMAAPEGTVFATGSLYLVGDLRSYWRKRKPGEVTADRPVLHRPSDKP